MLYRLWRAVAAIILLACLIAVVWHIGREVHEVWERSRECRRSRKR